MSGIPALNVFQFIRLTLTTLDREKILSSLAVPGSLFMASSVSWHTVAAGSAGPNRSKVVSLARRIDTYDVL